MNTLILPVALVAILMVSPASAQYRIFRSPRAYNQFVYNPARGERGPGNGPYWQGEPNDRRSIWRHNYYRGNDPDNRIRHQLMRDR
jgi:hypothetical protein